MTALYLLLSLLSALGFYLPSPHQRLWPAAGRAARALRLAAGCGSAAATAAAIAALGTWAGLFAALTALMLALVLLPYVDAWRFARKGLRHVG